MAEDQQALRRLSRDVLGQAYLLEVMLAVAESTDGLVTLTDLAAELGISPSNVQGALRRLKAAGLVTALPVGTDRRRFLLRNSSAAWDWACELRDRSRERDPANW